MARVKARREVAHTASGSNHHSRRGVSRRARGGSWYWRWLWLLLASQAVAQTPTTRELVTLSLEELSNMEIQTVSKKPERLAGAAASIFVITAQDIRRSGATVLPEVLRLAPNLQVARIDADGWAISARGFNSSTANKLLVLIDGRTVYTPLFSGVFWDVQDVMLADIERIEVISGPGATVWGSNAVNGVINVVTRKAADAQGGLENVAAGSEDLLYERRYGGEIGERGHYRVYGKFLDIDATENAAGDSQPDAWQRAQAGFRVDLGGGADRVSVQGDIYNGQLEQATPGDRSVKGFNLLSRWAHQLNGNAGFELQFYYDRVERDHPGIFAEDLDIYDIELRHQFQPWRGHDLVWGGGHRFARDVIRNSAGLAFLPATRNLEWSNLFVQDEISLGEGLRLTAGLRWEHNRYSGDELMPNLRLAWALAQNHSLWASASRAVRTPSRIDREFFFPGSPPFFFAGGPGFQAEVLKAIELGYRAQPVEILSFSVTAFYHDYDRLRNVEPVGGFTQILANTTKGRSHGVEGWMRLQLTSFWRLSAGAVLIDKDLLLKSNSAAADVGTSEGNDAAHQWQLRSSFDLSPALDLDVALRRMGSLPNPEVPSYTELDLRIAWRLQPELELALSGHNLLDPVHPEFGSAATRSEIERRVNVQLRWSY